MKNSEQNINNVMENTLNNAAPNLNFESLWNLHNNRRKSKMKFRKHALIPVIVILTLLAGITIGYAALSRNVDDIDLPFVDDPEVIGMWETVDYVSEIEDFNPESKVSDGDLYLSELVFIKEGGMLNRADWPNLAPTTDTWTQGVILSPQDKTASKYEIREINGSKYMFMEWKSGDYVFRFIKPKYYVLKQTDTADYSSYMPTKIEDKIDYPFVNNPEMLGKWESVDFVKDIDSFDPEILSYQDTFALKELKLLEGGEAISINYKNRTLDSSLSWTDNLIISQRNKTASKCEFRQINNETYMFYEWKSGDYIYREMKPQYYVLKKVQ